VSTETYPKIVRIAPQSCQAPSSYFERGHLPSTPEGPIASPPGMMQFTDGGGKSNGSVATRLIAQAADHQPLILRTTNFAALPNGTLIEIVRPGGSVGNALKFLVWDGMTSSIVDYFDHDGYRLIPPQLDEKVYRNLNLRLPTEIDWPASSAREIFDQLCDLLHDVVDLPKPSLRLVVAYILATWFIDQLPVAPYLCITGPPGSGKTTLLRWLHCLCRRAVLIAGPPDAAVYSLPALLRPTLLLDEGCFNATSKGQFLECWLRASNVPGIPVPMRGQLVDGYGAKVLCSRRPVADVALASRALHISMVPTTRAFEPVDEEELEQTAAVWQTTLLWLRLLSYVKVEPYGIKLQAGFSPRMQDLQRALMVPFSMDQETAPELVSALSDQEWDAATEKHDSPEGLVVGALFLLCHQEKVSKVFVGQLACVINNSRKLVGEEGDLKPRAVGAILKSLGLKTRKMGNLGRGIVFTDECRVRVHDLLQAYVMQPSNELIAGCSTCKERFQPTIQPQNETARPQERTAQPQALQLQQLMDELRQAMARSEKMAAPLPKATATAPRATVPPWGQKANK